jgi:sec-independent protein translocase protein TatC
MQTTYDNAPQPQHDEAAVMSWLDHLRELRDRLLRASLAVVAGLAIGFGAVFYDNYRLLEFLKNQFTPDGVHLIAVSPAEVFTTAMQVALGIGVSLAMPVIVYQLLAFIVPALTTRERRIIYFILPFISLCFLGGLAFGWFVTVPSAFYFLLVQGAGRFDIQPTISNFLSLLTRLLLLNGFVFELPVLVYGVIWLGAVERKTLTRFRRYAILVITIIAAIITPTGDPVNLALVAIPMYLLYELGLLLALLVPHRRTPATTA